MKTNNDKVEGAEEPEEEVKEVHQSNIAQSYLCPVCGNQVKYFQCFLVGFTSLFLKAVIFFFISSGLNFKYVFDIVRQKMSA